MSQGTVPVVTCDDEGGCDVWAVDYYEMGASVPKIPDGWTLLPDGYYMLCPGCTRRAAES